MNWSHFVTGLLISASALGAEDHLVRRGLQEVQAAEEQAGYLLRSNLSGTDLERIRYIQQRLMSATSVLQNSLNGPGYPPPPPQDGSSIELYHSDSCSGELLGRINYNTNCEAAFRNETAAWAIKINGQCMDISDMPSVRACQLFKGASTYNSVKIYHSDSCHGELLAIVNYSSSCQSLVGLPAAWGIEVNGKCTDISDMPAETACERFKQ